MKKVIMLAAVVAALASCQSKTNKATEAEVEGIAVEEISPAIETTEVYEGTLPAADGPGIRYVLTLDMLADANDTTYTLDMTYLDADGKGKDKTFTSSGKPKVIQKTVKNKKKSALKLTPNDGSAPVYFVIANDTTLTLSNDSLQEAVSDLNYDIVRVK
ncbi:copper resistance protein NlpE N-terminal domain-containing protein [Bacteroides sp.]